MSVPMAADDILRVRQQLQLIASIVRESLSVEDLDDFIRTCEGAEAVGPFIDPTAWMAARDRLPEMLEHARALRAFRKALEPTAVHS